MESTLDLTLHTYIQHTSEGRLVDSQMHQLQDLNNEKNEKALLVVCMTTYVYIYNVYMCIYVYIYAAVKYVHSSSLMHEQFDWPTSGFVWYVDTL